MGEDPSEQAIIDLLLSARPAGRPPPVDAGQDDCAALEDGLLVTTDTMVEGVHWDHRLEPADVGWKLVAVNVSDLASCGARPDWCTLNLCLPRPLDLGWVRGFAQGLGAALARYGLRLVGGDTTRSPGPRMASLTAAGRAPRSLHRQGARAGDLLCVTGAPGRAAAGFFRGGWGLAALRRPDPPLELAQALAALPEVHAMMDLSDGIGRDLSRLCRASGVGAEVEAAALPWPAEQEAPELAWQLAWGDDYELLFACAPSARRAVLGLGEIWGRPITVVGGCTSDRALTLRGADWPTPLYTHFDEEP